MSNNNTPSGLGINFLPDFYQTPANKKFIQSTIDQLFQPGTITKTTGFIGRENAKAATGKDLYVTAADSTRQNYQLEPGITVQDSLGNVTFFKDYIDYINQLGVFGANTGSHARLNKQEFYSWDPHIDWDKFINFQQYYWLPFGPTPITIYGQSININSTFTVEIQNEQNTNEYLFTPNGLDLNPTLKLYRGQTYTFEINSPGNPFSFMTNRSTGATQRYVIDGINNYGVELGTITFIVPVDAPSLLYYQSETDINLGGAIEIFDIKDASIIDVDYEIVGKKNYTYNGLQLSNGMKLNFGGTVTPSIYQGANFYVEGVGTSIRLVPENILEIVNPYTTNQAIEFGNTPFDSEPFDDATGFSSIQDYIVINRASNDHNPWSRYNRWFHQDVISASAEYNGQAPVLDQSQRATRPIIEFQPNLKLFNMGLTAIADIDLVDNFTTDVFSSIEGALGYNIDSIPLANGQRILFTADKDPLVANNIYKVSFVNIAGKNQITLTQVDTAALNQVALIRQGAENQSSMYWFNGTEWTKAQQKTNVNQAPLFDMFDNNGVSFSDTSVYTGSTFAGTPIFSYKVGSGIPDTILGFPLSYQNVSNIGDIVFTFNLASDSFEYKAGNNKVTQSIDIGYLLSLDYVGNETYVNGWQTCFAPYVQAAVRIYKNSGLTNNFAIDIFDVPPSDLAPQDDPNKKGLDSQDIRVYINETRIAPTEWSLVTETANYVIKFANDIQLTDVVTIKVYSSTPINENGYYEIPINLQNNPLNDSMSVFTLGEVSNHVDSIIDNIYQESKNGISVLPTDISRGIINTIDFSGVFPGDSNLRDLGNVTCYGTKFVQHSGPISLSLYHITNETNNVIKSIKSARDDYSSFKRNFLQIASNLGIDTDPVTGVDLILQKLNANKPNTAPYYFSDMVPYGASVVTNLTVVDYRIKTYPLTNQFDLNSLSNKAVTVYWTTRSGVKKQLVYGRDYSFSNQAQVVLTSTVGIQTGDTITTVEYDSTDGSFVPATPTKFGMWPAYIPQIYRDTTLVSPQNVIQGHDGSITLTFGDYRDALLLELETRIFNNIKVKYDPSIFNVLAVIPGYSRQTDYTLEEFNQVLAPSFYEWSSLVGVDFTTQLSYDRSNSFTFNYSDNVLPDGTPSPGYWRGVYRYMYDTDRPHLCPWEMLGFTQQPNWWTSVYGPAPYTRENLILWQDLATGTIREPGTPTKVLPEYVRPFLLNFIPVDETGNLVSPLETGISFGLINPSVNNNFVFGDISPVESAWRRSSYYPFSVMLTSLLLTPAQTFGLLLDRSRVERNLAGQLVYSDTQLRIKPADVVIPSTYSSSSRIQTAGIVNYVIDYLSNIIFSNNQESFTAYQTDLTTMNVQLSYRMGAFSDKSQFNLLLESKTPLSTGSIFVPQESYNIFLNTSSPVNKLVYSGVIITKLSTGFEIKGYSKTQPYFNYYNYLPSGQTINVGGISESYAPWTDNQQYIVGQVVKYNNKFYRATSNVTANTAFDPSSFALLPSLPIVGGVNAIFRTSWDKSSTQTLLYGTQLASVQEVVDFLLGYSQYLNDQGFVFDEFNSNLGTVSNWLTSAKEFMFWTTQNWSSGQEQWTDWLPNQPWNYGTIVRYNGNYYSSLYNIPAIDVFEPSQWSALPGLSNVGSSVISLSPSAKGITFTTNLTVVDSISNPFNTYEMFKVDGTPISPTNLNSYRDGNVVSYSTTDGTGIYCAAFYLIQNEHVVIIDNVDIFNDVIYNPTSGYRRERIKVSGYVTTGWYGGLDIPGFIFDGANVSEWQPWKDYNMADVILNQNHYYSANSFIAGTATFNANNWTLLKSQPTKKLLPNWTNLATQFVDFYSLNVDNFDSTQQKFAQHLVGYQTRQYLNDIIQDPVSEFKFYQGMIREKGTQNVLNHLFGVLNNDAAESLTFYEEWAVRTGRYGAADAFENIEISLDTSSFANNPQGFYLTNRNDSTVSSFIIQETPNDIYLKPTGYNSNPFPIAENNNALLRTAGYVKPSDVKISLGSIDDIVTQDITKLFNGQYVWCAFESNNWNVYRFSDLQLRIQSASYDGSTTLTLTTENIAPLVPGTYVGLSQVASIQGFYKVESVSLNVITLSAPLTTYPSLASLAQPFTQANELVIYVLVPQRTSTLDSIDTLNLQHLNPGSLLWTDSYNGNWATWKYNPVYNEFTLTDLESSVPPGTKTFLGIWNPASNTPTLSNNTGSQGQLYAVSGYGTRNFGSVAITFNPGDYVYYNNGQWQRIINTQFGTSLSINSDGTLLAVGNSLGTVAIYDKVGTAVPWVQRDTINTPTVSVPNSAYPSHVVYSNQLATVIAFSLDNTWLATGSPTVGYAISTYQGLYNSSTAYTVNQIVSVLVSSNNYAYYKATKSVPANNTPSATSSYWTSVPYIPVDSVHGTNSNIASQGVISIYKKDTNNIYTLVDTVLSPLPVANENFGSSLVFSNNALYVGAPGDSNGRVYKMSYKTITHASAVYNPVGSSYSTIIVGSTAGILPGMVVVGNGFTSGQIVESVVNSTTLILNGSPDSTPSGTLTFVTQTWSYDWSELYNGSVGGLGTQLVISNDGSTMAMTETGVVKVYKNTGSNFTHFQDITGTEGEFGVSVAISSDGSFIAISDDYLSTNVIPQQGSVTVYELLNNTYSAYQTLINHNPEPNGLFGNKIAFANNDSTIVVYSKSGDNAVPTTFDSNTTTFDRQSTNFKTTQIHSGRVDVYDRYVSKWVYSETLSSSNKQGDGYGVGFGVSTNSIILSAPYNTSQSISSGLVFDYTKPLNAKTWTLYDTEQSKFDINFFKKAFLYNKVTGQLIKYLDIVDPLQGKIPGPAAEEITYQTFYDPASYSYSDGTYSVIQNTTSFWSDQPKGQLWWDLRTSKFLENSFDDIEYRNNAWNTLAAGASVDVYEWVSSSMLPSAWDNLADTPSGLAQGISGTSLYGNSAYSSTRYYDNVSKTFQTTYYFWVKNKKIIPANINGRNMASNDVSALIANPKAQGYTCLAITGTNTFSLINASQYLQDVNTILSIEYWTTDSPFERNIHSQWKLISNDTIVELPSNIEQKWFDSLCGIDSAGRAVPDPLLPIKVRYGIENRPRQGMFVNRVEALKQFIERVNRTIITEQIAETRDISLLESYDTPPTAISGMYDVTFNTVDELSYANIASLARATATPVITNGRITGVTITNAGKGYINAPYIEITGSGKGAVVQATINSLGNITGATVISSGEGYNSSTQCTIRSYSALIVSDSTANGAWSIYAYDYSTQVWSRTLSQSYDVRNFWKYVDWFATGYSQFTAADYAVNTIADLNTINPSVGQIVKVLTANTGGWLLLERYAVSTSVDWTQSYSTIGIQNGTIQFSSDLYAYEGTDIGFDSNIFDSFEYDVHATQELSIILNAIKNKILINDLKQSYLDLFISSLHYVHSEQLFVDWAFKTSFVRATHTVGQLSQPVNYPVDNLRNFQDYISEVKPYRTKVREYITNFTGVPQTDGVDWGYSAVTDFDLQPNFENSAETAINVTVNNGVLTVVDPVINSYPWKFWYDNVGFKITDIVITNGGAGYANPPVVKISAPTGENAVQATAIAYIANGVVNRVAILNPGSGYLIAPSIVFDGGLKIGGTSATGVAIIGEGVIRSATTQLRFDRVDQTYYTGKLNETNTFIGTGSKLQFVLTWAPNVQIGKSSITVNGQPVLTEDYTLSIVTTKVNGFTQYIGYLTFSSAPPHGANIVVSYEKDSSVLTATDRINYYYNPTAGQLGKDLSQLMTGVDYGGTVVSGLDFNVSGGWGENGYLSDTWDSRDPTFNDYYVQVSANQHVFVLPYAPTNGTSINIYYVKQAVTSYTANGTKTGFTFDSTLTDITVTQTMTVATAGITKTISAGSAGFNLVLSNTTGLVPGMVISGAGFTQRQKILRVANSSVVILTAVPDGVISSGETLTFSNIAGTNVLNLSSVSNIEVGDVVTSANSYFAFETVVTAIDTVNNAVTLNQIIFGTIPTSTTVTFTKTLVEPTDLTVYANGTILLSSAPSVGSTINITGNYAPVRLDDPHYGTGLQTNSNAIMTTPVVGATVVTGTVDGGGATLAIGFTTDDGGNASSVASSVVDGTILDDRISNVVEIPSTFTVNYGDSFVIRESTSDGSIPTNASNYDTLLDGGNLAYSTATGLLADDIVLDGDKFVTPTSSPAPEEVVPGQLVDTLAIKVYDQASSGSANIKVVSHITDGTTSAFSIGQTPNSERAVVVKLGSTIKTYGTDYTVDYKNKNIVFNSAPTTNLVVSIFSFGFSGSNILDIDYFIGDGTTTEFITRAAWVNPITPLIYIDGIVNSALLFKTDSTYETAGVVGLRFTTPPASGSLINYMLVAGSTQTFAITKTETVATTGAHTYTLQYPIGNALPNESNMIVRVDQSILKAPNNIYFTIKANQYTYVIDPAKALPNSVSIGNIFVYAGGNLLVNGRDYVVDPSVINVKLTQAMAKKYKGQTLLISFTQNDGYSYNQASGQITFVQAYDNTHTVEVISNYVQDILDIERTTVVYSSSATLTPGTTEFYTFNEIGGGIISMDRPVIDNNYVWVIKNTTLLTPSIDYKLNDDLQSITLASAPSLNDTITIMTFGTNILPTSGISYMQFKDMLNRVSYIRLNANKRTTLAHDLHWNDTTITVSDASGLDIPNISNNKPGVIEIRGERIEYFTITGNILGQLRRGTLGTGIYNLNKAGAFVQAIGASEYIPYSDTTLTSTITSPGGNSITLDFAPTDPNAVTVFVGGYNDTTAWAANTEYSVGDIVVVGSYTYKCIVAHTSGTAWEKNETDWDFFVPNIRLQKAPYSVFNVNVAPYSPAGDVSFPADFTVNGSTTLTLTNSLSFGTKVNVVRQTGTAWDGYINGPTNPPVNVINDSSVIANFLKAAPGIWYTDYKD